MGHLASRGLLAGLTAFLAVTTIAGAVFVVPTLPPEWLVGSIFTDYTVPAAALRRRTVRRRLRERAASA